MNEIYTITHNGLTDLVSARVASRVLKTALRKKKLDPDTVTSEQMRAILTGPVVKDLTGILPRMGLERALESLIDQLSLKSAPGHADEDPDDRAAPDSLEHRAELGDDAQPPADEASSPAVQPPTSHFAFDTPDPAPQPTLPQTAPSEVALLDAPTAADSAVPTVHANASVTEAALSTDTQDEPTDTPTPPEANLPTLSEADLDKAVLRFTQLDHVKMVAALSEHGEVTQSRGDGFDVARLSRLGSVGLKLLARGGHLRAYYLAFSQGQLFFFPLNRHTLCIIGTAELNLGLVFSTLEKLKEEM